MSGNRDIHMKIIEPKRIPHNNERIHIVRRNKNKK